MPAMPPIKKNDEVYILRGKDRGKTGRVLIVIPKDQKVVVEGIQKVREGTLVNTTNAPPEPAAVSAAAAAPK